MRTQHLTTAEIAEALENEFVPAKTITAGKKYYYSAKVGGACRPILVTVVGQPYIKTFSDGRKKQYVTVHSMERRIEDVQTGKLLQIRKKCS
jgi:hypothetical protein